MKIKIWCCTHESEVFVIVDPDWVGMTVEELEAMSKKTEDQLDVIAEQYLWEEKQPECGFEIIHDGEE